MADGKEDFKVMMARLQKKLEAEKALKASAKASAPAVTPPVAPPVKEEAKKEEVPMVKLEVPEVLPVEAPVDVIPTKVESPTPAVASPTETASVDAPPVKEKKTRMKKTDGEATPASPEVKTEVSTSSTIAPKDTPPIIPTPPLGLENVIKELIAGGVRSGIQSLTTKEVAVKRMVKRTFSKSGVIIKSDGGDMEEMETPSFTGPVATVSVSAGQTVNLGDYNSTKIDIFLSVPCNLGEEANAFEYAKHFVLSRMATEVKEIKEVCSGR